MTFEEVSKKYPLGMIVGEFCPMEYESTKEQVHESLGYWEYNDFFYIQGKDRNAYFIEVICILETERSSIWYFQK